ncbi:MAG: DUF6370 family protein [Crocinitomicaceae bacterium]|nr:DUF6370 family protein [Crocinitomicaceae bacterium]
MKKGFVLVIGLLLTTMSFGQVAKSGASKPDPTKELLTVDATCGECNFGMEGDACDLAVKINGNTYYVDGIPVTEYGHPHNKGGFCVAMRKAEVQGEIVNGRFKASYFKLLKEEK